MKDVKFVVDYGILNYRTDYIEMEYLPKLGEYINTVYFHKFKGLENKTLFKVINILHYYNHDMSKIDYTEIYLQCNGDIITY